MREIRLYATHGLSNGHGSFPKHDFRRITQVEFLSYSRLDRQSDKMTDTRTPTRLRRAKLAKRAQLAIAFGAAVFALYRILAPLLRHGMLRH